MMCMNHVLMNVGGVHVNKRVGKSPAFSVSINSRIITILVLRVLLLACFIYTLVEIIQYGNFFDVDATLLLELN